LRELSHSQGAHGEKQAINLLKKKGGETLQEWTRLVRWELEKVDGKRSLKKTLREISTVLSGSTLTTNRDILIRVRICVVGRGMETKCRPPRMKNNHSAIEPNGKKKKNRREKEKGESSSHTKSNKKNQRGTGGTGKHQEGGKEKDPIRETKKGFGYAKDQKKGSKP